uniref:ARAD1A18370p n=1 Tax=Blastobotrys adeninivorans TaxID=409370 RepID=A0A060SY66_BLAAD
MVEYDEQDLEILLSQLGHCTDNVTSEGGFPDYVWKACVHPVNALRTSRDLEVETDVDKAVASLRSLYQYYFLQYQERALALEIKGARWDNSDKVVVADNEAVVREILISAATDSQHIFAQPFPWFQQFDKIQKAADQVKVAVDKDSTNMNQHSDDAKDKPPSERTRRQRKTDSGQREPRKSLEDLRQQRKERVSISQEMERHRARTPSPDKWVIDCIHELYPTVISYAQVRILINAFLNKSLPNYEVYWRFIQSDPGDKTMFIRAVALVLNENDSTFDESACLKMIESENGMETRMELD